MSKQTERAVQSFNRMFFDAVKRVISRHVALSLMLAACSALVMGGACFLVLSLGQEQFTYRQDRRMVKMLETTYEDVRQIVSDHISYRDAFKREDGGYSNGHPIISDSQLEVEIATLENFRRAKDRFNKCMKEKIAVNDFNVDTVVYDGAIGGWELTYGDLVKVEKRVAGYKRSFWLFVFCAGGVVLWLVGVGVVSLLDNRA